LIGARYQLRVRRSAQTCTVGARSCRRRLEARRGLRDRQQRRRDRHGKRRPVDDFFGGAFADLALGEKLRAYAGVGPVLQFGQIDFEYQDPINGHVRIYDSGFGTGYYTRIGLEFQINPKMSIGAGFRYVDTSVDFGGAIDSMDFKQEQYLVTFTESY